MSIDPAHGNASVLELEALRSTAISVVSAETSGTIACYALHRFGTVDGIILGLTMSASWPVLAAVPCLVSPHCDDAVRLIASRDMARSAGVFGDRFYISSERGYDAELARNVAAAWRPEGVP